MALADEHNVREFAVLTGSIRFNLSEFVLFGSWRTIGQFEKEYEFGDHTHIYALSDIVASENAMVGNGTTVSSEINELSAEKRKPDSNVIFLSRSPRVDR